MAVRLAADLHPSAGVTAVRTSLVASMPIAYAGTDGSRYRLMPPTVGA